MGKTDIAVEVDFTFLSAMEVRSFQTNVPGNHLANIDDLLVLMIYDREGTFFPARMVTAITPGTNCQSPP